jgi:hypothetical protein
MLVDSIGKDDPKVMELLNSFHDLSRNGLHSLSSARKVLRKVLPKFPQNPKVHGDPIFG